MAWTTPRTWTTGEVVTAAQMNTHVRDNLAYLKDDVVQTTRIVSSSGYTLPGTSTWYNMPFDSESIDEGGWHDNASNNDRITVSTDGLYLINYQVGWGLAGSGRYITEIQLNGGSFLRAEDSQGGSLYRIQKGSGVWTASANDYFSMRIWSSASGAAAAGGALQTFLQVTRLRVD